MNNSPHRTEGTPPVHTRHRTREVLALSTLAITIAGCAVALTLGVGTRVDATPAPAPTVRTTPVATPEVTPTPTPAPARTTAPAPTVQPSPAPASPGRSTKISPPAKSTKIQHSAPPAGMQMDWTADASPPEPDLLPLCAHADSPDGCYYPGRSLGDSCDWVNSPLIDGKVTTWFFNCDDPALEGVVTG